MSTARALRIDKLKERISQLTGQLQQEQAKERADQRKIDTRKKILLGAMVMNRMEQGFFAKETIREWMDSYLTRDHDRALFDLPPLTKPEDFNKGDAAPSPANNANTPPVPATSKGKKENPGTNPKDTWQAAQNVTDAVTTTATQAVKNTPFVAEERAEAISSPEATTAPANPNIADLTSKTATFVTATMPDTLPMQADNPSALDGDTAPVLAGEDSPKEDATPPAIHNTPPKKNTRTRTPKKGTTTPVTKKEPSSKKHLTETPQDKIRKEFDT